MTPKQEAFARAYVETGNASEAYRQSYNAENMKDQVIRQKAYELLQHGDVSVMVKQLREGMREKHEITVGKLTDMAVKAYELAMKDGIDMPAAAVSAVMGLGKLHGLITEKREVRHVASVEDIDDSELSDIALAGRGRASKAPQGAPKPN